MRRLKTAGFPPAFVKAAILPDWWDDSCAQDRALLDEIEFRVSRFLGLPLSQVRDPSEPLGARPLAGVQLRHTRGLDPKRLLPAVHAGTEIAAAVARTGPVASFPVRLPPVDPAAWRASVIQERGALDLEAIVSDLWSRGIPVIRVDELPSPKYQGMACIVEEHPVIVLGRAHNEPPRLAFLIAHEVAHIVHGDCEAGSPVVDAEENVDSSELEVRADSYAWRLLTGGEKVPRLDATNYLDLAQQASDLESATGIDAGFIVWSWTNRTGDFVAGVMALKALYLHRGGEIVLGRHFASSVDLDSASETDRSLLACIVGAGVIFGATTD